METCVCIHKEDVKWVGGIQVGTCKLCGQVVQYGGKGGATLVELGRIDGKLVLPKGEYKQLLGSQDKDDLRSAVAPPSTPIAPGPELSVILGPNVRGLSKGERTSVLGKYYDRNRDAIMRDFEAFGENTMLRRWGISKTGWLTMRVRLYPDRFEMPDWCSRRRPKSEKPVEEVHKDSQQKTTKSTVYGDELDYLRGWRDCAREFISSGVLSHVHKHSE